MGSPSSPIVANLYMEDFEVKSLNSSPVKSRVWYLYVDDTFVIIKETAVEQLTEHINSQDWYIKFTVEPESNWTITFLDTKVSRQDDSSLRVTV